MSQREPRNPLATLAVAVSSLNASSQGGAATRRIGVLQHRVRHLRRLIAEMVDLARITAGKLRIDIARLDFREVVREAVGERRKQFEARQQDVSVVWPAESIAIDVDPERIRQIVRTLLVCAHHWTPKGGRVEIEVSVREQQARLQICDGTHRVLREKSARHPRPFRSGLQGLRFALVRRLIQSSGGTFTALREERGGKNCFIMQLSLPTSAILDATP
jgi:signal transduction histidine kinase